MSLSTLIMITWMTFLTYLGWISTILMQKLTFLLLSGMSLSTLIMNSWMTFLTYCGWISTILMQKLTFLLLSGMSLSTLIMDSWVTFLTYCGWISTILMQKFSVSILLVGGWSLSFYFNLVVFGNLQEIFKVYWEYLLAYLVFEECLSFAVSYRYSSPANERRIHLLTWGFHLLGWLLIFLGILIWWTGIAFIVFVMCANNLKWAYAIYRKVRTTIKKPDPPHLLTEEEYLIQGEIETHRALEELREYCNSLDFTIWRTASCIHFPERFSDFVEGGSHLIPNEIILHKLEFGQALKRL